MVTQATRAAPAATAAEHGRARQPDETGFVVRDGIRVAWERYGDGEPTILLMPTWSIFPSRHWKFQIGDLARFFRVLTFDGRGNGRSDRPDQIAAYADTEFSGDAVAVLDAAKVDRAVLAGLSMGAGYAIRTAVEHPDRVLGLVLIGSSIAMLDRPPDAAPDTGPDRDFEDPRAPEAGDGWGRYNAHFWRQDWRGFLSWFVGTRIFSETHSTKHVEDGIGWGLDTDAETIIATERAPFLRRPDDWPARPPTEGRAIAFVGRVGCPALVIHGTEDRVSPIEVGRRLARELDAPLLEIEGGGHAPNLREPVLVNLRIRDFVRKLRGGPG
jgi:pimeloyl-ACP methyl ester carboxylesterase